MSSIPTTAQAATVPTVALAQVQHRIQLGVPLPFDVLDLDRRLLLATGQVVANAAQLEALTRRGALVALAALQALDSTARLERLAIAQAPRAALPGLWNECLGTLNSTLAASSEPGYSAALDRASAPVLALVERDPDLAIFQVMAAGGGSDTGYGARRSLQAAITAALVAQRLHWAPADVERAFKVSLTANVSMLALQGELARQPHPPTVDQRLRLQNHPMQSVQMLEQAGVRDADWLQAVLQHHEQEDGSGYPSGRRDPCDQASLARRADVYTAKLAGRSSRGSMAADLAGREMFMQDPGHPMTAALVKEFGIYPPGAMVRLANGAVAVVVERGPTITAPVVACLSNERGQTLPRPLRVSTAAPGCGVVAVVGEKPGTADGNGNGRGLARLADLVFA